MITEGVPAGFTQHAEQTLSASEIELVQKMMQRLDKKRARNIIRQQYYDQKIGLKDLGISTPPALKNINSVLGWPAKTVDVLADRIKFERFVAAGEDEDPHGLNTIVADNDFRETFAQTAASALTHSCAFITITQGDKSKGEPEILLLPKSAHWATGIWDKRTRNLKAGLSITKADTSNSGDITPREVTVYLPDKTVIMQAIAGGGWEIETIPNPTGRPLIVPVVSGADLRKPFGRSRISRAVMALTDSAIRTVVRSEISAEFYASPQRYLLGADEDALTGSKWSAVMSKMLTISRDEDGQVPQVGQFSQMSMQPHTDQLRQWASLLAAESQIPIDELGFPSDNPASDSAIQSQRDPLRLAADRTIRGFKSALNRIGVTAVMLREGINDPSKIEGLTKIEAWFAPTVHVSDAAAADAVLKQVQVMPWLAQSPVILEKLGYDDSAIQRLMADKRRAEGSSILEALAATAQQQKPKEATTEVDNNFSGEEKPAVDAGVKPEE
jgi:hypothetical protein